MKILFVLKQTGYLRHFDTVVEFLTDRGHHVRLASQDGSLDLSAPLRDDPAVSIVACPKKRGDGWAAYASLLRRTDDYLRYLVPPYAGATKLRARAFEKLVHTLSNGQRDPAPGWSEVGLGLDAAEVDRLRRLLGLVEQAIPSDGRFEEFLRRESPDIVLVTPLIDIGSGQTDIVKSARALGIPVGMVLFSWDNLSTKGSIHVMPDQVFVWNEIQRREAVDLHGVPSKRVTVTGAPRFDRFIELTPATSRAEYCQPLGLDPGRPTIVYLGSSKFVASDERPFVQQWIRDLRAHPDATLSEANILIKPHPDANRDWADDDERPVTWPALGRALLSTPFDGDRVAVVRSRFTATQFLHDCLYHAAAVVGLNTSAEIEAGILGRPVLTLAATGSIAPGQTGTLHFHYLLRASGGFVDSAASVPEHLSKLADALAGRYDAEHIRSFITSFIRPRGWQARASKVLGRSILKMAPVVDERPPTPAPPQPGDAPASAEPVVELDYRRHRIWIRASTDMERRWRARPCAKEPWTVEWIESSIRAGDVLYDIGANVGAFSLIATLHCERKVRVVAFEPGYASFAHLCDNIVLNQCEAAITPLPFALSSRTALAHLKYRSREAGQSRHALVDGRSRTGNGQSRYQQPVLAYRLDDVIAQFDLPRPTHLKIDVDGSELRVLEGATDLLASGGLRSLLVEIDQALGDEVTAVLAKAGFTLAARHGRAGKTGAPWYGHFERPAASETVRTA